MKRFAEKFSISDQDRTLYIFPAVTNLQTPAKIVPNFGSTVDPDISKI